MQSCPRPSICQAVQEHPAAHCCCPVPERPGLCFSVARPLILSSHKGCCSGKSWRSQVLTPTSPGDLKAKQGRKSDGSCPDGPHSLGRCAPAGDTGQEAPRLGHRPLTQRPSSSLDSILRVAQGLPGPTCQAVREHQVR